MYRPYIICHMLTSIDGKVTGDFLSRAECEAATEIYYEINREYKARGSGGFICGRITMETSFTGGYYPDLSQYAPVQLDHGLCMNYWNEEQDSGYYAIAFDPRGKLGWQTNTIEDSDPGYGGAQIIEVLTENNVDPRYLSYLREKGISYFFAGKDEIDVPLALKMLSDHLSPEFYVLEGGSVINGHFLRCDCVDEISVVQVPICSDADSKPLFCDGRALAFELSDVDKKDGSVIMRYVRQREDSTDL